MSVPLTILAALAGYFVGAISFARIVVSLKTGGPVQPLELSTPDGQGRLTSSAVSATAVRLQLGPRYGILVGILDILKAFVPTLALRLLAPGEPYYLAYAAATAYGHNWPIYHRFRGGNGQAVILGGILAIDWVGAVVTNSAAIVLGRTALHDGFLGGIGGIPLLVPWLWWRFGLASPEMAYAVAVNVAWWVAFWPTFRQYLGLKREGHLPTPEDSVVMFRLDFPFMHRTPRHDEAIDALAAEDEQHADTPDGDSQ